MRDEPFREETSAGGWLGRVVSGSLSKGLTVKLDSQVSVEDLKVGRYATIEGQKARFFGMVTDITLSASDPQLAIMPPDLSDPFIGEVLAGTSTFGTLQVMPSLAFGQDATSLLQGPQPVKTVPAHFSPVRWASEREVALVFGEEDERHFAVGTPLDMETKVCLDLNEFVKRSNGVFGKSGTGKTFFTRLLLIGLLQKGTAVNLVFDMHSEYGWESGREDGRPVKGLKQLFPTQVAVFALDAESAKRRRVSTDFLVEIGYDEIEPEDIQMLRETLNLTEASLQATYSLERKSGKKWLEEFLAAKGREELHELAKALGEHEMALQALHRRLQILKRFSFLVPQARESSVDRLLEYLDRGIHVVLEFGRHDDFAAYILVANVLTRRLHERYRELTERALGEGTPPPRNLVVTLEEAHRFLHPEVAPQTIFGTIAREMRKYHVTLLVIDQRPSGIDEEVLSQLGTKTIFSLDNERDIESVLAGVAGRGELRSVLARLESRQQALLLGHAVPVPVVIRTPEYGSAESYGRLQSRYHRGDKKDEKDLKNLWGP